MNSNTLQRLKHDTTRQVVISTRGELLPIKEHRGWKYINYEGQKIGLNKIPIKPTYTDPVFEYVFGGGAQQYPCPAMDYWIARYRMKQKITPQQFKTKYNIN